MQESPAQESFVEDGNYPEADASWAPDRASVAVIVRDSTTRRLVDSAVLLLDLRPEFYDAAPAEPETLNRYEMVIADEDVAVALYMARDARTEILRPALVAVRGSERQPAESSPPFESVLALPITLDALATQLSLALYTHRAFASRYQSALDELHLNRSIFRSVTSGISVASAASPDLPLVYVNPAFEVMTGYALEEIQGRNCRFLQGPEPDQASLPMLRAALREEREVLVTLRNYRKDGSAFWNELYLSPIKNREGKLTHYVGIQSDISARVEFERALRESEKLAAVGRLASSIAHEINNPLESVMNLLYLALESKDAGETRAYVEQADKEVRRVALITSQSLRFYKQSTRPQAMLAGELLESVLDLYESRVQNAFVGVTRRYRSEHPVVCLESEIRQVLNNLVRNAIEAMHARGGRLMIRTRDVDEPVPGVVITVADTGSGISPDAMEQMYKPFFTTKGIGGTGLGLWISREIVTRHAGTLRVRSSERPGASGTVFQLFLPAKAV